MDSLIFFLIGFLVCYIIVKHPIQIVIHHKNENLVNPIPEEIMPKMSEVTKQSDPDEDEAYKEMGQILANVQDIFGGSDRDEQH